MPAAITKNIQVDHQVLPWWFVKRVLGIVFVPLLLFDKSGSGLSTGQESGFFDRSGLSVGHAAMESSGETISLVTFPKRVATVELGTAQSNKESAEIQNPKEQVALLKESAAKKDSELSSPRTQEERYERGTSSECRIVYTRQHFQKVLFLPKVFFLP